MNANSTNLYNNILETRSYDNFVFLSFYLRFVQRLKKFTSLFLYLLKDLFPVFLTKLTLIIQRISVLQLQISMIPGFAIIDYKLQRSTFWSIILDLRSGNKTSNNKSYNRFYLTYVQLSWLLFFDNIKLLKYI